MQVASRNEVIRLTRLDGCIDDFYPVLKNQALLTPSEGQSQQIRIEAEDDSGNRSILEFRTIRQPAQRDFRAVCDSTALIVDNRRPFSHTAGEASVHIPAGVFYEPLFFQSVEPPGPIRRRTVGRRPLSPLFDPRLRHASAYGGYGYDPGICSSELTTPHHPGFRPQREGFLCRRKI